jgi:two-component system response regulator FixJ
MPKQPELALVDDDDAVRESIVALLAANGIGNVRAHGTAESLICDLENGYAPDVIVSDIRLPGMSGLELQVQLRRRGARAPLILITGHGQVGIAVRALKAGAADFIEKPFEEAALTEAIGRALEHAARLGEEDRRREEVAARIDQLSQRQKEVMDLVVQGLSSKEIAARLGISPRTVETYRLWIMEKTGARNLAELVRMAMLLERS